MEDITTDRKKRTEEGTFIHVVESSLLKRKKSLLKKSANI